MFIISVYNINKLVYSLNEQSLLILINAFIDINNLFIKPVYNINK